MLSIRFTRKGSNKKPFFRVVIMEKSRDTFGNFLENLGTYNPKTKEAKLEAERINYWISHGAQPSPTVQNLLVTKGIVKTDKVRASKSKPGKKKQLKIDGDKVAAQAEADKTKAEVKPEVKVEAPAPEVKPEIKTEEPKTEETKA